LGETPTMPGKPLRECNDPFVPMVSVRPEQAASLLP